MNPKVALTPPMGWNTSLLGTTIRARENCASQFDLRMEYRYVWGESGVRRCASSIMNLSFSFTPGGVWIM